MSKLKCKSCGEKSAFITTKGSLEKVTSSPDIIAGTSSGWISITPKIVEGLINLAKIIFNKLFGLFEKNNEKYIICESCGYYAKLDEE